MSVRERLTVKIDVKDAIFGGVAIYVSVLLVSFLLIFVTDLLLRVFNLIGDGGQFLPQSGLISEHLYGIFIALILAIFLVTFFLVVLFDENLFSKHENSLPDLLGLGLVWGMTFMAIDTLVETFLLFMSMYRDLGGYYIFSVRGLLFGLPYWIAVAYIILLPAGIFYLRKSHKEHMERTK